MSAGDRTRTDVGGAGGTVSRGVAPEGSGPSTRDRFGSPGDVALLMGNEAIARGALEAGVSFCAGYPGNPSSEIIGTLEKWAAAPGAVRPLHVEWSVNETVAVEAAAGASHPGLGALVAMKQNGLNLCADFLTTANLTGVGTGGLVVVVCDDPGPLTSSNEEDSRLYAKLFMLPLLEPSTPREAREMTGYALDLSRREGLPVLLRSVSRVSHGRAGVPLGEVPAYHAAPRFDRSRPLLGLPHVVTANHRLLRERLEALRSRGEGGEFNRYGGPERAEVLVIASGLASLYAWEAVEALGLEERVGVLGLGMVWPFPADLVAARMAMADRVLVVEQIEPFVEEQVRIVHSEHAAALGAISILGKGSGHLPAVGETGTDAVVAALEVLFELGTVSRSASATRSAPAGATASAPVSAAAFATISAATPPAASPDDWRVAADGVLASLPPREISFCFGCPHRASFWAINNAMELDGREGVVLGDIGCYGLAAGPTGFSQLKTLHCMGAGIGIGSGLGVLGKLGFSQPVLAVAGDSTFYHACLPALINARQQKADLVFVVLDNSTTAMTGFQPHPGAPAGARDSAWVSLPVEQVCAGIGVDVEVLDPVADVRAATEAVFRALRSGGLKVLVLRKACATWEARAVEVDGRKAWVDPEVCLADACGCDRFCARVLGCPGNRWDADGGKAYVDPDYCNACGLCVQLCPANALSVVDEMPSAASSGKGRSAP
ncbi:MAG: thiamine pyrophosphate-dependent enzyme [Thermoleophilia bacterium]